MLYKFLPSQRVGVLSNGLIRFSQPNALNDPYESRALVMPMAELKAMLAEVQIEFEKFLSQHPEHELAANEQLISKTKLDLHSHVSQRIAPWRVGQELMRLINKQLGILSLTRRWDNLLMWAHYGEAHQGLVVGLNDTDDFFFAKDKGGLPTKPFDVIYT